MNSEPCAVYLHPGQLWHDYINCQSGLYVAIFLLLLSIFLYGLWKKFLKTSGPQSKIDEHLSWFPMPLLVILAGMVIPHFVAQAEQAREAQARVRIYELSVVIESYKSHHGKFPTTEQGLNALVTPPAHPPGEITPYIDRVPPDPWKNSFIYVSPGRGNRGYSIISRGPDGIESEDDIIFP